MGAAPSVSLGGIGMGIRASSGECSSGFRMGIFRKKHLITIKASVGKLPIRISVPTSTGL